jgi:leucyl aminopeptidase
MKFEYKPTFDTSNKNQDKDYFTIFVNLDSNEKNKPAHYNINSKELYKSLKKFGKQFDSTLELYETPHFVIHLGDSLVENKDKHITQHIIWKFLKHFLPWEHKEGTTIIITHTSNKSYDVIADFIEQANKIRDARLLAMAPANIAYPSMMADHFKKIFTKIPNTHANIITYEQLKKHKFGLILAVGESAEHKPEMLVIERRANVRSAKTVCIVGKGITFDTGGLSIKSNSSMVDMKYDKIGAIYSSYALAHMLEDKRYNHINFVGIFPFAENAVSGKAIHPGDVVTSYLGKTVEITDPDAEGRLILADAFAYSHKFKPDLIVDIATLTGHAENINCWHHGYYYAVPAPLKEAVEKTSFDIGDPMLPMPTWDHHDDVLESEVADFVNDPINCSDAYTATLFMKQFVPAKAEWLHIDLTHEFDGHVPHGNGIRTVISIVEWWLSNKK